MIKPTRDNMPRNFDIIAFMYAIKLSLKGFAELASNQAFDKNSSSRYYHLSGGYFDVV